MQNATMSNIEEKIKVFDALKRKNIANVNISDIVITQNGNVILKSGDNLIALGCILCIINDVEQDRLGYPMICGERLLYFGDIYRINDLDESVKSNTWLCPKCHIPIRNIYPNYKSNKGEIKYVGIQSS